MNDFFKQTLKKDVIEEQSHCNVFRSPGKPDGDKRYFPRIVLSSLRLYLQRRIRFSTL